MKSNNIFQHEVMPYYDALLAGAMKLTSNLAQAEDLVQDTMLKAYTNFDSYKPGTNCKAWLFRIMTNTFINAYRRSKREVLMTPEQENALSEKEDASNKEILPLTEMLDTTGYGKIFDDEVKCALEAVPPDFREVVLYADVQDFSYKEISDLLCCPMGTVMSRLHRGRKILKDRLSLYAKSLNLRAA